MKKSCRAFTLIELIVVLAIIAVILVVVTPKVTGYVADAKETTAKHNAMTALQAAELYIVELDRDGKKVPEKITEKDLDGYLNNKANDTFTIQTTYHADTKKYTLSGTYHAGSITIDYDKLVNDEKQTP